MASVLPPCTGPLGITDTAARNPQTGAIDRWCHSPCVHAKSKVLRSSNPTHKQFRDDLPRVWHQERTKLLDRIKTCRTERNLWKVRRIHADVLGKDLVVKDIYIATALITAYAKCGALDEALEVFEQLPTHDVVSWSSLIAGYAQNKLADKALEFYRQMQEAGVCPDVVTYISVLQACGIVGALDVGEAINTEIKKKGFLQKDVVLGTALVDMYAKCGALEKAREVFEQLPVQNVVSWSALIAGYAQSGLSNMALKCFRDMRDAGVQPDAVIYTNVLKACGLLGSLEIGEDIRVEVSKQGLLRKDTVLGTALVDMYSKCGVMEKALEVFDQIPIRDVVAWNALIAGYAQNGFGCEALSCFQQMQNVGMSPDAVTYICSLKACSIVGSLEIGEDIYADVRKKGLLHRDVELGNMLVDMYSKCGLVKRARKIFEQLPVRNIIAWSALISGYAQLGQTSVVLDLYRKMNVEGVMPDPITFTILLTACNHAGLVKEGELLFEGMCTAYRLTPALEHYNCMIDLFGRSGHFDKAKALLERVAHFESLSLFLTLLSSCRKWRNVDIGRWAFEQSVQLDVKCAAAYVSMGNVYVTAGMPMEADKIPPLRMKNKAWKITKYSSWMDVNLNVHSFSLENQRHPQSASIYIKLEEIYQKLLHRGYTAGLHWVSDDTSDNENKMCGHSAKWTVACALINTPEGVPVHITKSTRICDICHSFAALVSIIERRRIQVNDVDRVHIFQDGRCICTDDYH